MDGIPSDRRLYIYIFLSLNAALTGAPDKAPSLWPRKPSILANFTLTSLLIHYFPLYLRALLVRAREVRLMVTCSRVKSPIGLRSLEL